MKKNKSFTRILAQLLAAALLGACASVPRPARATAPTYHRFWRGKKLESLAYRDFAATLDARFVQATVDTGAGHGLIAYEPLLLDPAAAPSGLPDEIALVTYQDADAYSALMSTPAGQAYGNSHWQLFDRSRSGSLVPQPYAGAIATGAAYDLDPSYTDWQQGRTRVVIATRPQGLSDATYLASIRAQVQALKGASGLRDAAILVDAAYVVEYQSWASSDSTQPTPFEGFGATLSWDLESQASGATHIVPGTGINVRF